MLLNYLDGTSFATGAMQYEYRPATLGETTNRIILAISVEEKVQTTAVFDTGAPYVVLPPTIAQQAGYTEEQGLDEGTLLIRGKWVKGSIGRLNITLQATQGNNLDIDSTVFVPKYKQDWGDFEMYWSDFPAFLGLSGFLERIRFAIDPNTDTFYFGSL